MKKSEEERPYHFCSQAVQKVSLRLNNSSFSASSEDAWNGRVGFRRALADPECYASFRELLRYDGHGRTRNENFDDLIPNTNSLPTALSSKNILVLDEPIQSNVLLKLCSFTCATYRLYRSRHASENLDFLEAVEHFRLMFRPEDVSEQGSGDKVGPFLSLPERGYEITPVSAPGVAARKIVRRFVEQEAQEQVRFSMVGGGIFSPHRSFQGNQSPYLYRSLYRRC